MSNRDAFSLTEVVLALGIAAFALIAMIGLLPVGFKSVAEADNDSRLVNLVSSIIADRRTSPASSPSVRYSIPALGSSATSAGSFDVSEEGRVVSQAGDIARFTVNFAMTPPASDSLEPHRLWMRITRATSGSTGQQPTLFETITSFPQ